MKWAFALIEDCNIPDDMICPIVPKDGRIKKIIERYRP